MKKIVLLLLASASVFAQSGGKVAAAIADLQKEKQAFAPFSIFTENQNFSDKQYQEMVADATIATLDLAQLHKIVDQKNNYLELQVPYQGKNIAVLLYKVNVLAEGFQLDTDKQKNLAFDKGVHYRGIVKNDPASLVSFNFFGDQVNGIISARGIDNLTVGKLQMPGNISNYIVYSDSKLKRANDFSCATKDILPQELPAPSAQRTALTNHCVTIYFEMEYSLYTANGNSVPQSMAWMTSVFNNVQTLYNNDGISTAIKSIFVWTSQDPYQGNSSSDYLQQFHDHTPLFNGDLGQLVGIDQGLGGVAVSLNGICTENNYSYADVYLQYNTVPVFSWTVEVITHELGHLMGSPHTHGCYWNGNNTAIDGCGPTANANYTEGNCPIGPIPDQNVKGTIMSYCHLVSTGINLANGFGPQPAARIINKINNAQCLGSDCVNTCISMITNINVTNISLTTAQVSWTDPEGTVPVEVAAVPYPFDISAATWIPATGNPHTFANLNPNTYYQFYVRKNCASDLKSLSRGVLFATADDFCAGRPFTDTGGASSNYGDDENWIRTVAPVNPSNKIKLVFTSINIEANYDYLYIFNGTTTDDLPLVDPITGAGVIPPVESTDASGALTFQFVSDSYETRSGWTGNFSCTNLGVGDNDYVDFSYFPNPVTDNLTIKSRNEIGAVAIYSIDGKLLYQNDQKCFDQVIDMSGYAVGTYVFKLQFESKSVSFKVVRQ